MNEERVNIEVGHDAMMAWVILCAEPASLEAEPLEEAELTAALEAAEINITEDVEQRCRDYLAAPTERALIAVGTVPAPTDAPYFEWAEEYVRAEADWRDEAPVDHYSRAQIVTVKSGSTIGQLHTPPLGDAGRDVLGNEIPSTAPPPITVDEGTIELRGSNPQMLVAKSDGRLVEGRKFLLEQALCIEGDVGFDTGNIESLIEVRIGGMVPDGFKVVSERNIIVERAIEGAEIRCGGDLIVKRGIIGRGASTVQAETGIVARYLQDATVFVGGELRIGAQLLNSAACVKKRIVSPNACQVGGFLLGGSEIQLAEVGNEACIRSSVTLGVDPDAFLELIDIERRLRELSEVEDPSADEEAEASSLKEQREAVLPRIHTDLSRARLIIRDWLHEGATVRIGEREAFISRAIRGPLTVEVRPVEGKVEMAAIHASGTVDVIPSATMEPETAIGCYFGLAA